MAILILNGSTSIDGVNSKLLDSLEFTFPKYQFIKYSILALPLFQVALDINPLPDSVIQFRKKVSDADAVIISTPVYIYNIPAVLKSALEWLTTSGELVDKKVLAITYTPNPPRGEKAMQSLLNSLKALDANIVSSLSLHQTELKIIDRKISGAEQLELLSAGLDMLSSKS